MNNRTFGYARCSSQEQNEERQVKAFLDYELNERDIFIDKQSGKDFEREQYSIMKKMLRGNDLLVIKSIDRLGRDYEKIMCEWKEITKNIGADIIVLDMELLDTRKNKDLLGTFISDLVLQILSYVAEQERTYIKQRQKEGIQVARARGVEFGRPRVIRPSNFNSVVQRYKTGEITRDVALKELNLKANTFYNFLKDS